MSSRERWDVVLSFLNGPLARHGQVVVRGPVVRLGARPGADGLALTGYRGLDDRQAVITVYEDGRATLAPVGTSQVRLAPHEHVDWQEVYPLREPAYLTDGCAFHLGPVGRGVTVRFVKSQPLGVWREQRILSDAASGQAQPIRPDFAGGYEVGRGAAELSTDAGRPAWFIPGMVLVVAATMVAVIVPPLLKRFAAQRVVLGPQMEQKAVYEVVPLDLEVDPVLLEGLNQPFLDFVMAWNAEAAGVPALKDPQYWDTRLLDFVTRATQIHGSDWAFWMRLEQIRDEYGRVVAAMREARLPEVFAAIPYQESQYTRQINSPVCAGGYWQFMPEVGRRAGLVIRDCRMRGTQKRFTPTRDIPVLPALKSEYVALIDPDNPEAAASYACRITDCAVDERSDLDRATEAAIELLAEVYEGDPLIRSSGAAVQIAITSHNAGYDDSRYEEHYKNPYNVLPAYERWLEQIGAREDASFIGQQIQCEGNSFASHDTCGAVLNPETQHYAYPIIAIHFLAVCYYGQNYGADPVFSDYTRYLGEDAYCGRIEVPTAEQVRERM